MRVQNFSAQTWELCVSSARGVPPGATRPGRPSDDLVRLIDRRRCVVRGTLNRISIIHDSLDALPSRGTHFCESSPKELGNRFLSARNRIINQYGNCSADDSYIEGQFCEQFLKSDSVICK